MAISNNVREVLKRYQVNTSVTLRPLFCSSSLFCYSIISPCSYWNSNTLDAIIENGPQLNNKMHSEHCITSVTLPDSVTIFGTNINVHVDELDDGELGNLTESRISLETLILRNHTKIKRNVRLWNMIYNLFTVRVKLLKLKGNTS